MAAAGATRCAFRDRHARRRRRGRRALLHAPRPRGRRQARRGAHGEGGGVAPGRADTFHRQAGFRCARRGKGRAPARRPHGDRKRARGRRRDQFRHRRQPRGLRGLARGRRAQRPPDQLAHACGRAARGAQRWGPVRLRLRLPENVERSLRLKVTALVLAITIMALALTALALALYDLRAYERQSSQDLLSQAEVLGRAAAPALSFNDQRSAEKDLSVMQVRPRVLAAALYPREGRLFATYSRPGRPAPAFPATPGADGYGLAGDQMTLFRSVVENNERVGTVYLLGLYAPWEHLGDYLAILLLVTM